MKYARFDGLKAEYREAVLAQVRNRMLAKRNALIKRCGQAVADNCWWAKLDYINSWTFERDMLFAVCEDCGRPTELMSCISDVGTSCQQRKVIWECPCGKWHQSCE